VVSECCRNKTLVVVMRIYKLRAKIPQGHT
jgi:hypothetical protein